MKMSSNKKSKKLKQLCGVLCAIFVGMQLPISAGYKGIGYEDPIDMRAGQTDAGSKQGNTEIKWPIVKNESIPDKGLLWHKLNNNEGFATAKKAFGWTVSAFGWTIKQYALMYGVNLASTLGHELGHAIPFWIYGDKAYLKIDYAKAPWNINGGVINFRKRLPQKFMPCMFALGPIGGVITSLGALKATNIYDEYKKGTDIQIAFKNGMDKSFINIDQPIGIQAGVIMALLTNGLAFLDHGVVIDRDGYENKTDGRRITDHFNLQGIKAQRVRGSMASGVFSITAYLYSVLILTNVINLLEKYKLEQ